MGRRGENTKKKKNYCKGTVNLHLRRPMAHVCRQSFVCTIEPPEYKVERAIKVTSDEQKPILKGTQSKETSPALLLGME